MAWRAAGRKVAYFPTILKISLYESFEDVKCPLFLHSIDCCSKSPFYENLCPLVIIKIMIRFVVSTVESCLFVGLQLRLNKC